MIANFKTIFKISIKIGNNHTTTRPSHVSAIMSTTVDKVILAFVARQTQLLMVPLDQAY